MGDLNEDGSVDLVVSDVENNMIEIVSFDPEEGFRHRLKWRVFEEKLHGGRSGGGRGEPRELLVEDLDGDGRADLVILVHDRLLICLQDD